MEGGSKQPSTEKKKDACSWLSSLPATVVNQLTIHCYQAPRTTHFCKDMLIYLFHFMV